MNLRSLSDLFLYELWTLCDAKKQVIAVLLRMSRLASNYELLEELKANTDQANEQMYLLRTIISSYHAIPPVEDCDDGSEKRSEEHTSELQSLRHLVCRLLLEK